MKKQLNRGFQPLDWLEILGGSKAKVLAVILMALSVVIYFYMPQIVFTKFSFYGACRILFIPFMAFIYIVIDPIREYFSSSDKLFLEVYLVVSWLICVAPLIIVILALLSGEQWNMCNMYIVCG